jgi:hypothetical protein
MRLIYDKNTRRVLTLQDEPSDSKLDYEKEIRDLVKLARICTSQEAYKQVR